MKKIILSLFAILSLLGAFGQEKDLGKIADSIKSEGVALYKSEWASWYGTDIFTEKCQARRAIAGGYISYDTGEALVNVFFSKGPEPKILSTITFGYGFDPKEYKLDTANRDFSNPEKELYTIRQNAIARINKDTLFKTYSNTELNPVPLIRNGVKKVYVLTGTDATGVVLFGNDYRVDFDDNNNVTSVKKLHKGLIPARFSNDTSKQTQIQLASMHTHLPKYDQFITSTDICTLMLYEKFTTWNQCVVMSKNYTSIWDCKRNQLIILTTEAWKKMNPLKNALENNSH
ncbi:hypothetical protein [Mucilaginibacter ginsenosidivorans]|uniref:Uncharacterized protein n=1 Tax=Mucilaginibacter ginsenosidivorans TaxID=398053 RepID=A0A5B8URZ1_9SPHI|nr:hypothetical protein [Mucilaginibacter ginsenosidivorans]QEC61495.1 hypothetical protein FRZ54_02485 [Mucilaginibacter ginsenosidivorans]